MLDGRGNSATGDRVALLRRYLRVFNAATIRCLLGDREFIGCAWIDFLCENNIPFAIRLKGDLRVTTEDGCELTLNARLPWRTRPKILRARLGAGADRGRHLLTIAAKRLPSGASLIVVSNRSARTAMAA